MLSLLMLISDERDRKKFETLYITYQLKMQYVAFGILHDEQEAENIVHDTFVTLIDYLEKIDEKECHKTWNFIVTILKNKCFNYLKRQKTVEMSEKLDVFQSSEEDLSAKIAHKELEEALTQIIRSLNYPYREVIYLQYYNEMGSREIAELLDLSPENVRQISARARKKIKDLLRKEGYAYGGVNGI